MTNISERANKYAEGKAYDAITQAIAQAYEEGYRDGYEDGTEKVPVELPESETKFVDLGLPSGTLWAADYEKEEDKVLYLPHEKANVLSIPTKEQWDELFKSCQYHCYYAGNTNYWIAEVVFVGPNGNLLKFNVTGWIEVSTIKDNHEVYLWLKDDGESNDKQCVNMYRYHNNNYAEDRIVVTKLFSGYKLPVRLVQNP